MRNRDSVLRRTHGNTHIFFVPDEIHLHGGDFQQVQLSSNLTGGMIQVEHVIPQDSFRGTRFERFRDWFTIAMHTEDHQRTISWGSSVAAQQHREEIRTVLIIEPRPIRRALILELNAAYDRGLLFQYAINYLTMLVNAYSRGDENFNDDDFHAVLKHFETLWNEFRTQMRVHGTEQARGLMRMRERLRQIFTARGVTRNIEKRIDEFIEMFESDVDVTLILELEEAENFMSSILN